MFKWSDTPIEPRFRTIDGLTIRFAESDGHDEDALLLSPWPESLLAFEQLWSPLTRYAHLVAIDLPGFGRSERRDGLLSPRAMGEFAIQAADAFGLRNPHVLGPGTGAAALLFAAAAHPGRLRSLVVDGSASSWPQPSGAWPGPWTEVATPGQARGRYALPEHVRDDYACCYAGNRLAESARYLRAYPAELPALRELLPEIATPVQIIAGGRDTAVPVPSARFLRDRLPHSRLDIVDAGHFPWEEAAGEYAAIVTSWWGEGHTSWQSQAQPTTGSVRRTREQSAHTPPQRRPRWGTS